jgi:hypothetical protein
MKFYEASSDYSMGVDLGDADDFFGCPGGD